MKKIKDQKIIGNFLDKLRKLCQNGTVNQKFLAVLKQENSTHIFIDSTFYVINKIGIVVRACNIYVIRQIWAANYQRKRTVLIAMTALK